MPEPDEKGKLIPKIDYAKCTGKGICIDVCPEDIFEIRNISEIEQCEDIKISGLCPDPKYGVKDQRSYPVNADNCTACEICVKECPEEAIILIDKNC